MLTGIPRAHAGQTARRRDQPGKDYGLSYPTLGALTTKVAYSILSAASTSCCPMGPDRIEHPTCPDGDDGRDDEAAGQSALHAHTFTGGPRLVMGMTRANEPVSDGRNCPEALAAAAATGRVRHLLQLDLADVALSVDSSTDLDRADRHCRHGGWLITSIDCGTSPVNERLARWCSTTICRQS